MKATRVIILGLSALTFACGTQQTSERQQQDISQLCSLHQGLDENGDDVTVNICQENGFSFINVCEHFAALGIKLPICGNEQGPIPSVILNPVKVDTKKDESSSSCQVTQNNENVETSGNCDCKTETLPNGGISTICRG